MLAGGPACAGQGGCRWLFPAPPARPRRCPCGGTIRRAQCRTRTAPYTPTRACAKYTSGSGADIRRGNGNSASHLRDDTGMPGRQPPAGILRAACTHQRQRTYHAKQGTMGCRPCGILGRETRLRATAICRSAPMPLRTAISNARGGPTGRVWDAGTQGGTLTLRVMAGDISK